MRDLATAPYVFLVSYPRSGQHFTQHLLEEASGKDEYCEFYNCLTEDCPAKNFPTNFRKPCYSGKRLQKNHDFDLDLPYYRAFRYAVLYRDPVTSIQSYYEWSLKNKAGIEVIRNGKKIIIPDSIDAWSEFSNQKSIYWREFVKKWKSFADRPGVSMFYYEQLVDNPDSMRRLIYFCSPSASRENVDRAIDNQMRKMRSREKILRDPGRFRYLSNEIVMRVRENTREIDASINTEYLKP